MYIFLYFHQHYAMKTCGGVDLYLPVFLTSALFGGERSASRPCRFIPVERAPPRAHYVAGWVGPRTSLDDMQKLRFLTLRELELRILDRPVHS
jgi:hypothetical protein